MKRLLPCILAAALAAPVGAAAQVDLDVRVIPRAGAMTPAGWFYVQYTGFFVDPIEWTEASILRAPVAGLAVELDLPGSGLWVRGEALRSIDAITAMTHAVRREASGFDPPRVEKTPYRVATSVTTATLDLALPTRLRLGPVQPYVTAGVGGKWYGFDTDPFQTLDVNLILPQSGFVAVLNLGAGAVVELPWLTLDLQVRDAISEYWDLQQNDVMFLAGVSWQLF
jgi:hypothetical protein